MLPNLDWLRDPVPSTITPFQQFIRDVAWSKTELGPISAWSRELRQTVRLILADISPSILYWGASRTIIYNEAYVPLVGNKHPLMMGMPASLVFPDFWAGFETILDDMARTGQTASGDASRLLMKRHGFLEETYFDWKLIPVIGDEGYMLGAYGVPSEKTETVIGERRTKCVQELSQKAAKAGTFADLWAAIMAGLAQNDSDIPFALLLVDTLSVKPGTPTPSNTYEVVGSLALPNGHPLRRQVVDLADAADGFASFVRDAVNQSHFLMIPAEDHRIAKYTQGVQWKGSGLPCRQFVALPIASGNRTPAVLVVGLNPNRRFNAWYERYLGMISDVLASSLSKLRLSEELKHRAEMATKAVRDFERSEMRFSRFAARSTVGLAVTDLQGKVLYANDAWYDFVGLDPTSESVQWRDTIIDEDLPIVEEWWHKVAVLKQSGSFTFRSKTPFKSGDMYMPNRTGFCACYADSDEIGGIETIMAVVVDISEQKWIETQLLQRSRELEASEHKYRKFADLCPLGIVSTDASGYVKWGNDAWHAFYNFTRGQKLDPQPWLPYIHDDDVQTTKDFFHKLQTEKGPFTVELRLKRKYVIYEGDKVRENDTVIIATGVQEFNPDGTVDHIDFIVTEISAQKMAEKILTEKMEEAIRNRTQQERFIDMISHEIRNPLSALLHCGEEIADSMNNCLANLNSDSTLASLYPRGNASRIALRDMLQSALEAANTISYCVQHQKNIVDDVLTLSKLDSDLLLVSPVPVKLSDLIQSAIKIFDPEVRMSDITLETIEHESISEHNVDWLLLDPNRFLQIVINLVTNAIKFTRLCETRHIKLTTSVHNERPCDFEKLDYVPRKYDALQQKGALAQTMDRNPESEIYLRVSVSDTGKGLSSQEKKLLFQRFAQASPKTHAEYGGSGLGLFISRQIAEMLGGEIGVGSSPSGGCVFAFYVATSKVNPPRPKEPRSTQFALPERTMSAPTTMQGVTSRNRHQSLPETNGPVQLGTPFSRKVLVVEDNVVNQKILCKQLRNRGFEIETANNGQEALAALEKALGGSVRRFDAVLMDVEMPVMDGIAATRQIRKLEEVGTLNGHIPVIGVTANVRSKQVDSGIEAGMDGITTKPYRLEDLVAHIDRLCVSASPAS